MRWRAKAVQCSLAALLVLSPAMSWSQLRQEYQLALINFRPADILEIERHIMGFAGYVDHRPIEQMMRRVAFRYQTRAAPADLRAGLQAMLDRLGHTARMTFAGNRYEVERIVTRGDGFRSADQIRPALDPDKPNPAIDLTVEFAFDSAELTEQARAQLDELGWALHDGQLRTGRFALYGHTDAVGSDAYNLDLSRRRAEAVGRYLVRQFRIDRQRLALEGFGERRLKNRDTPFAAENRRVEVVNLGDTARTW